MNFCTCATLPQYSPYSPQGQLPFLIERQIQQNFVPQVQSVCLQALKFYITELQPGQARYFGVFTSIVLPSLFFTEKTRSQGAVKRN